MQARVVGVYIGRPGEVVSLPLDSIVAEIEGIKDDRHFGLIKLSGVRERGYPRGTVVRNNRQFSAVSLEELAEIAKAMGIEELSAGLLGANLAVSGIPNLTQLPPLSRLVFPSGATLVVYGENLPCHLPGEVIQHLYPEIPGLEAKFVKSAFGRRGVVGWVECAGKVQVGDEVLVKLPKGSTNPQTDQS